MKKRRGIWALIVAALLNASLPMLISIGITGIATTAAIGGIAQLILFKEDEEEVAEGEKEEDLWDDDWGDDWIDYDGDGVLDPPTGVPGVDGQIPNGVYPSDPKLKVRAQVIELAKEIGEMLNCDPRIPFMMAQAESSLRFDYDDYENSTNPDVYRDLIRSVTVVRWDKNGRKITTTEKDHFVNNNMKIGPVLKDKAWSAGYDMALGPFQFETKYVDNEVAYIYNPKASGNQSVSKKVKNMSQLDSTLGINRPNAMYMPDAMYNVTLKLVGKMNESRSICERDPRWKDTPKDIQDIILFNYAADAYRGTMNTDYKNGADMHKAMVSFYLDIYEVYGSFDFMAYTNNRPLIMGTQRPNGRNGWDDWDGTLDSPITVGGKTYTKSLLQEMTEKTKTGYNYLELFNKIENNTHSERATYNKLGLAHGMRGLAGARTFDEWNNSVKEALIEEGKLNNGNNNGEVSEEVKKLQKAVCDVAHKQYEDKVMYLWGGKNPSEGLDCSGLVYWSYKQAGFKDMPILTANDYYNDYFVSISADELQPADTIYRRNKNTGRIEHVYIYMGEYGKNGNVIEAYSTGYPVRYNDLSSIQSKHKSNLVYGRHPQISKMLAEGGGSNTNNPVGTGGIPGIKLPTPVKDGYKMDITSQYGWRNYGGEQVHKALDISGGGKKVPIYSILDGEVVQVSNDGAGFTGYGNVVRIKTEYNGNKYVVQYNHLDSFNVKVKQKVKAGQQIGKMGSSGGPYAVHLDLEVELNSPDEIDHSKRNRINPLILYGYNPSIHKGRKARNEWLYAQGFNIQCTSTCYDSHLISKNNKDGYSTFNCKKHLGLSSKYPD